MKNILVVVFALVMTILVNPSKVQAQDCDSELYSNMALKKLTDGFTFIKSFKIDGKGGTRKDIEYTCVFSKDTKYKVNMRGKDGDATGIIATLYNSKREKLASSYTNGKFYTAWTYQCKATGIYYLRFSFKDSHSFCGGAVLGFKR